MANRAMDAKLQRARKQAREAAQVEFTCKHPSTSCVRWCRGLMVQWFTAFRADPCVSATPDHTAMARGGVRSWPLTCTRREPD